MLKKTMVLFLSMLLILSCIPGAGVFAAVNEYKTYTEDFEDGDLDDPFVLGDSIPSYSDGMLKLTAKDTSRLVADFGILTTTNDAVVLSYDVRFDKFPTTEMTNGAFFNIGRWPYNGSAGININYTSADSSATIYDGTTAKGTCVENKWYQVVIIKESIGNGSGKVHLMEKGGALICTKSLWMEPQGTDVTKSIVGFVFHGDSGAEISVDNVKLDVINQSAKGPALLEKSIDEDEAQPQSLKEITVKLDQPIKTLAATLTPDGGSAITCTVADAGLPMTYKISWTADLLYNKKYTLDLSGSKNRLEVAATGTVVFTTEEEKEVVNNTIVYEDFEDDTIDTTYFNNTLTNSSVVAGIGKDGSKALKISANATGALNTKSIVLAETDRATLSFDFMMTKNATAFDADKNLAVLANPRGTYHGHTVLIQKFSDGSDKIKVSGNQYDFEVGKWYRAAVVTQGSDKKLYYYALDEDGQLYRHELSSIKVDDLFYNVFSISTASDAEFVIDNINYTIKTYDTCGPVLAYSSIKNNATGVPATTKSMKVNFDSPFYFDRNWTTNLSGVTLTPEGGSPINCTATRISEWGTNLDYVVSWSADLEKGKKYTLDFSNTVSTAGAKGSGSITFTTQEPALEESVIKDSFENESYFTSGIYGDLYGDGSTKGTSDFVSHNYYSFSGVSKTTGYTGNGALISKSEATSNTGLFTRNLYTVGENEKMVFNFRMKIKDAEIIKGDSGYSGGNSVSFGLNSATGNPIDNKGYVARIELDTFCGKHYVGENISSYVGSTAAGRMGYYYKENNWYNVYWTLTQGEMEFIMVDDTTGEIVYKTVKKGTYTDSYGFTLGQMLKSNTDVNNGTEIVLDDLAIWKIDDSKADNKTKIVSDFVQNAEIDKNTDSVVIEFNQPVLAERSGIEIFEGDECIKNTYRTPFITYPDFKKIKLDFSNLEYASEYTADFGGITSVGGAAMEDNTATLTFKTAKDATKAISVIGGIEGANFTGSGVLRDTVLSVTINNNTDSTIDSIRLFAAVYSTGGDLIGIESADSLQSAVVGRDTAEITFDKDYEDAMKIKLFVWNDFSGITPLAETEEAYGGATEVLMIGNSLSEDASKYLHKMAQADGNEKLNLTVAYIGGSSIDHHYANFKNELENETYEQLDGNARDTYYAYENGESVGKKYPKITELLKAKRFDVITLQEYCFNMYSYDKEDISDITYIVSQIRKLQPNAKIMLYECWAKNTTTKSGRNMHYLTQIAPWYKKVAKELKLEIIPSGRAFNLAQESDAEDEGFNTPTSVIGNTNAGEQDTTTIASFSGLYRDADHASLYGRYLTDAVIYEAITGKRVSESFDMEKPDGISDEVHAERISELRDFAHKAILEFK